MKEGRPSREFSVFRHGEKTPEGVLSERGREEARKLGDKIFEDIQEAEEGTVVVIAPSNVERTQQTRDEVEGQILEHFQEDPENFMSVDAKDTETLAGVDKDTKQKVMVTGMAGSTMIGIPMKKYSHEKRREGYEEKMPEFPRLIKELNKDEDMIVKIWLASSKEELEGIRDEIRKKHPEADVESIKPSNFDATPEAEALNQLRWMNRMNVISKKHFPENPVRIYGASHNAATDYLVMKMMGNELNSTSFSDMGAEARKFLEEHKVTIDEGKVVVEFRGERTEFDEARLKELEQELKAEDKVKREKWEAEGI